MDAKTSKKRATLVFDSGAIRSFGCQEDDRKSQEGTGTTDIRQRLDRQA
jgi:hypothetical protein